MQDNPVPLRIVVADDNPDVVASLSALLELDGHQVFTACNGELAVEVAVEHQPHLGILDIGMPKKNGYQVAEELRLLCPKTILVAVTGWGNPKDVAHAYEAGFHHHITKPAPLGALAAIISGITPQRSEVP
jgi:two-component system CheB/CheR fusion protein